MEKLISFSFETESDKAVSLRLHCDAENGLYFCMGVGSSIYESIDLDTDEKIKEFKRMLYTMLAFLPGAY